MTSSPPRSLPDLAITSLNVTQYANSALQALAPTTVTFGLSNYGPVSASNVQVGLYENNSLMGIVNFGTIPGNSSWTATINVSGGIGGFIHGSNLITVTADPKNLISESNKNNNSFSRYYLFFGAPNLQVVSIVIFPFIGTFTTMQSLPYGFNIRNDGNAPSANNSPGSLRINGDLFLSFSMPILNPGDSITGTLSITYLKSNTYNVLVQTSMHSRSMNTFVNYDVEVLAGRWQNASNLSVQAFSSITNSVNNWDNLRTYLQWNFHSNNVNFQPFQTHPNNISLGADFEMTGQALSGNQVGVTYLYKSGPSGLVPILYPYTDSSPFARADIRIKTGIIPSILTRTVVHEFGHGLGLDHPVCGDEALMRQDTDPLHAKNITFHDCHNLQSKYGN